MIELHVISCKFQDSSLLKIGLQVSVASRTSELPSSSILSLRLAVTFHGTIITNCSAHRHPKDSDLLRSDLLDTYLTTPLHSFHTINPNQDSHTSHITTSTHTSFQLNSDIV
jgi:hypothetical protein